MSAQLEFLPTTVQYFITADVDPGAISRVVEHFALRGITPDQLKVHHYKKTSLIKENLSIDIRVSGLSDIEQGAILQKLLAQVGIQNVRRESMIEINRTKLAS